MTVELNMPLVLKFIEMEEHPIAPEFDVIHKDGAKYRVMRTLMLVDDTKTYPTVVRYVGRDGTEYAQLTSRFCGFVEEGGKKAPRFTAVIPTSLSVKE